MRCPAEAPGVVTLLLALALSGIGPAVVAGPATGHAVNYASLDPQVSEDGTVYVESTWLEEPGWVVVYDGDEPVGHASVGVGGRAVTDVEVSVDADAWPAEGPLWLRVELFPDDGDSQFDPAADRQLRQFGPSPEAPVERGDDEVVVLAERGTTLPVVDGELRIRRAALDVAGHVVVERVEGSLLGTRSLSAGTHRNVSVDVGEFDGPKTLVVSLYRDDGDGSFGDGDEPLRVGNETVATTFTAAPADEFGDGETTDERPEGGDAVTDTTADESDMGFGLGVALAAVFLVGSAVLGLWLAFGRD